MAGAELLRVELNKLGLGDLIGAVLGQTLIFSDSADHIICGTITSIGYGPEEGVSFRVSCPKFHGHDINRIVPSVNGTASLHAEPKLVILGEFEIIRK